jgi:hypothetical protein
VYFSKKDAALEEWMFFGNIEIIIDHPFLNSIIIEKSPNNWLQKDQVKVVYG